MKFIREQQAAQKLCMSVQTLRNWRHIGKGPAYHKVGRSVLYNEDDLEKFAILGRINPIFSEMTAQS